MPVILLQASGLKKNLILMFVFVNFNILQNDLPAKQWYG